MKAKLFKRYIIFAMLISIILGATGCAKSEKNSENIVEKEKFIIGSPDGFREKFGRIEDYYRYVRNRKEEGYYSTVDVSYEGQIVCRK